MRNNYLIVGMGSIGARHLECLRKIDTTANIIVWRQFHKDSKTPDGADHVVFDLESALAFSPTCAILANPAPKHVPTALLLAKAGVHLLVEKPLSSTMDQVNELISTCDKNDVVLMVAYVLRFHPSLKVFREFVKNGKVGRILSFRAEVGQYLPDWRPGSDYRTGVSARKELGGGALLELSHELDYIRWIFGEVRSVSSLMINSGVLDIDVEDLVEAIIEIDCPGGESIMGSVHLDMLQRPTCRTCRVVGETGVLEWDALENTVRHFDSITKQWETIFHAQATDRNALFVEQIESFLDAVRLKKKPLVGGCDGKAVLQIVQAIRQSSEQNTKVVLP